MKKYILIVAIAIISVANAQSQHKGNDRASREAQREEIQCMKIAFMTETLGLTTAESEKFWPIYNKYWEERVKLMHEKRNLYNKIEKEEATQADVDAIIKIAERENSLTSRLATEVTKAISADKAAKTFIAEEKFKGTLLRRTQGGR